MNTELRGSLPSPTNGQETRNEFYDPEIQICIDGALNAEMELSELKQNRSYDPEYRRRRDEIRSKKDSFILGLLELRSKDPHSRIAVKLVKLPHEEMHELSQNRIIVYPHGFNDSSFNLITYLDTLAKTDPDLNSNNVLSLIGKPNITEDDAPLKAVARSFEEAKAAGRKIKDADRKNNNKEKRRYTTIKYKILTKRLLSLRRTQEASRLIKVGYDPENDFYHFGYKEYRYHQRAGSEITTLVEETGGYNFEETFTDCFDKPRI